jgi:hypothetical protein
MTHGNNIPPLNFDAGITEDDMERAKKMYENAIKSLALPRGITADYLGKFNYDSKVQLYDDWLSTWNQQLGNLTVYQKYRSLQIAMEKGSPAQIAMENATHLPGFATLATTEKYQRCLEAIKATASKKIGVIKLKKVFETGQQPANETAKDWYITKINEYQILHEEISENFMLSIKTPSALAGIDTAIRIQVEQQTQRKTRRIYSI